MKIVIGTDVWSSAVTGVTRVLQTVVPIIEKMGHDVHILAPHLFRNVRCPFSPDMRLAFASLSNIKRQMPKDFDAVHVISEGSLGFQLTRFCVQNGIPFTSSYTTHIDQYVAKYLGIPRRVTRRYVRWLHSHSEQVSVSTDSLKETLASWGIPHTVIWSRGVDTRLFYPRQVSKQHERVLLYVGRIAKDKNLEAFLKCKVAGKKYLVGDGLIRADLQRRYPDAVFLGCLQGEKLVEAYSMADVFVFPSRSDTFGLVLLEALACGVPVAAYPVQGPADIITDSRLGCLSDNLEEAIEMAQERGDKSFCRAYAETYTWEKSARQFVDNLIQVRDC